MVFNRFIFTPVRRGYLPVTVGLAGLFTFHAQITGESFDKQIGELKYPLIWELDYNNNKLQLGIGIDRPHSTGMPKYNSVITNKVAFELH